MTDYLVGTTVVLQAFYYSDSEAPLDPDALPTCEVHDSRGRVVQTNIPVEKVTTGQYQADFNTVGLTKGDYSYIFEALFDGKPDREGDRFTLTLK